MKKISVKEIRKYYLKKCSWWKGFAKSGQKTGQDTLSYLAIYQLVFFSLSLVHKEGLYLYWEEHYLRVYEQK